MITATAKNFIEVDATHRIERSEETGLFYPMHHTSLYTSGYYTKEAGTKWGYYRMRDRAQTCKSFKSERAARKFIVANA